MTSEPSDPRRPRWSSATPWLVGVMVALGALWWSTDPLAPVLGPDPTASPVVVPQPGATSGASDPQPPPEPTPVPEPTPPSAEVVALADEAFLSETGRSLLYAAAPEILGSAEFAGRCDRVRQGTGTGQAVGCYQHHGTAASIVIYAPADPRLRGFVVETVAHETLHAAWETLATAERGDLTTALEAELARLPADAQIHEQITGSVGDTPENRPTELFAYIGTQVWRDGGLDPRLEAVYSQFVTDRAALVAVHTGWRAVLAGLADDIGAAQQALADHRYAAAHARARHDGEAASIAHYRQAYEQQVAEVAALPEDERARLQLSWVWWDGTDLPMAPADQTLATAAGLLARDDGALAASAAAIAAEEARLDAERSRVDAMIADFEALNAQLDPAGGTMGG